MNLKISASFCSWSSTRNYALKENWHSLFSSYQLLIALPLGMGLCESPFSMLGFYLAWACRGFLHAVIITVSLHVQIPWSVRKTAFLCGHWTSSISSTFTVPSSEVIPKSYKEKVPHRVNHNAMCYSLYHDQLCVPVLITSIANKIFSDETWAMHSFLDIMISH